MPLGQHPALERLEPPDDVVHQPANLGELARDGQRLGADAVAHGVGDLLGERRLEAGRCPRERLRLDAHALEGGVDVGRRDAALRSAFESFAGSADRVLVHGTRLPLAPDVHPPRGRPSRAIATPGTPVRTAELDYDLPRELIAQRPSGRRDASRLLVHDRSSGETRHRGFAELPDELPGGTLVVVNDTRVVPARVRAPRRSGGEAEVLLLEPLGADGTWEALARPSRRLRPGERVGSIELLEALGGGRWRVRLERGPEGEMPLPPYIEARLEDPERYQTIYAREAGSAAAPTAGLHFTEELLERLDVERVTLHVGLDTFRPVTTDDLAAHALHGERYAVAAAAWERIRSAARVLAVGTTTVRVLETLARGGPLTGRTELFVTPGFEFRRVDHLLTNFHLPRSTLLALVMAFAGVERTRALYRLAIEERYRFYSFGDAMLLL